jgi:hypothetical protein
VRIAVACAEAVEEGSGIILGKVCPFGHQLSIRKLSNVQVEQLHMLQLGNPVNVWGDKSGYANTSL